MHQDGVAVGLRFGDEAHAGGAAGAGAVLHHEGLSERIGKLLGDGARGDVDGAARGHRHDDPHRSGRPALRRCAGNGREREDAGQEPTLQHDVLPANQAAVSC
jgi:hypothetical protein